MNREQKLKQRRASRKQATKAEAYERERIYDSAARAFPTKASVNWVENMTRILDADAGRAKSRAESIRRRPV